MVLFSLLLAWLNRLAVNLAAVCLVAMTLLVAWQVFARFVLNQSPAWAEPVVILLMSWFIFLGAAVGTREGFHLSFEVLAHALPPGGRRLLDAVSDLVVGGFGLAMLWYGTQLAMGTWSATMPALGLPNGVGYLPLATGGAIIALFSLERLMQRRRDAGAEV